MKTFKNFYCWIAPVVHLRITYGLGNVCFKGNFMGAFTPFLMPTKQTFNRKLKNRNQAIDLPIEVDIL